MDKASLYAPVYFKKILQADEELMNVVPSNKICGLWAHANETCPYIVYSRSLVTPIYTKDINSTYNVQMTYNIVTDNYEEGLDISLLLIKALEHKGYKNKELYIRDINIVSIAESSIEDKFAIQTIVFESEMTTYK